MVDQLVGSNDTRAIGPLLLVRSTNAEPRVNVVGTTLAAVAAIAFASMALAFRPTLRGRGRATSPG